MPRLLVVRHAIAEDREVFAQSGQGDHLRPLTAQGRERMERAARGLAWAVEPPGFLATSPFTRAAQTAAILGTAFGGTQPVELEALTPSGEYADLVGWIRGRGPEAFVAIVGHEPHLSGFVSTLLGARGGSVIELKKGAACLLEVAPSVSPGSAHLRWALAPRQLRRLGKG